MRYILFMKKMIYYEIAYNFFILILCSLHEHKYVVQAGTKRCITAFHELIQHSRTVKMRNGSKFSSESIQFKIISWNVETISSASTFSFTIFSNPKSYASRRRLHFVRYPPPSPPSFQIIQPKSYAIVPHLFSILPPCLLRLAGGKEGAHFEFRNPIAINGNSRIFNRTPLLSKTRGVVWDSEFEFGTGPNDYNST